MLDPGPVHAPQPTGGASDRAARLVCRYLLPATGGASTAFAALFIAGVGPFPSRPLAFLLMVAGLASVFAAFTLARSEAPVVPPSTARVARRRGSAPPTPAPPSATTHRVPTWSDSKPHSGLGRAAVAASPHAERGIWDQWETAREPTLGATLVGPVPETAYSLPRTGAIAPFAARDEDAIVISEVRDRRTGSTAPLTRPWSPTLDSEELDRSVRDDPVRRLEPFSAEDLDLLFPPSERGAPTPASTGIRASGRAAGPEPNVVRPTELPEEEPTSSPTFGPTESPSADFGALSWGAPGLAVEFGLPDHELYLESINPVPPHLRAGTKTAPPSSESVASGRCSICSDPVEGFRSWTPCPRCFRPVCRDCLTESLQEGRSGECASCRPESIARAA